MYKVYVRDQYFNRVAEISDYTSLEVINRFNGIGTWLMQLPTDSRAAKELLKTKAGIIVMKDNQMVFTGPVGSRQRKWDSNSDILTIGGSDDNIHLLNLAYPLLFGEFAVSDDDVRTGVAEDIMKQYVSVNIGPEARTDRVTISIEPNQAIGNTVTGRGKFQSLLELMQELALSGGNLGFKVALVNKILQFQVYQPADKTRSAFFSPLLGNLASFEYTKENPEANFLVIGGLNESESRVFKERGDGESIQEFGRYEEYIGNRGTDDAGEMYQRMDEELATKAFKTSLSISPIDTPVLAFHKHYNLGDKVSVVLTQPNEVISQEDLQVFLSAYQTMNFTKDRVFKIQQKLEVIQDVVREVKISLTPEGEQITPIVGTPESSQPGIYGLFDKMRKLSKRISNLERG